MPAQRPTTEGSFRKTPFTNVLLYAREKRLSGTLRVTIPPAPIADDLVGDSDIILENGSMVALSLAKETHSVAWVFRELDLITDEHFMAAQKALAEQDVDETTTLLRLRAVSPAGLDKGLREFHRRRLLSLFGYPDGSYAYYAGVDLLEGEHQLRSPDDVLPVVWRALLLQPPDEATIRGVLDKIGQRSIRLKEPNHFDRFEFGPELGLAAPQLRSGPAGVAQLMGLGSDPERVRVMIYLLALTKQIEALGTPTPAQGTQAAPATVTPASGSLASTGLTLTPMRSPTPVPGPVAAHANTPASGNARPPPPPPVAIAGSSPQPAPLPPAPPSPPAAPAVNEEELMRDARAHLARMENWTYFEMFDLTPKATLEEVRAAFTRNAAPWHPDRAPLPTLKGVYTEVFALYNTASATLSDPKAREHYESSLHGGGGTLAAQREVQSVLDSVQDLHRAEIALKRKNHAEAERLLRKVLEAQPDDPSAVMLLAQCLFETDPSKHLEYLQAALFKVIKQTEDNDRAFFLLGMVYKHKGDMRRAIGFFRQALEINANNIEAQREVRISEMRSTNRQAETSGIAGFFNKLLKK